jgi:hypothetical protein
MEYSSSWKIKHRPTTDNENHVGNCNENELNKSNDFVDDIDALRTITIKCISLHKKTEVNGRLHQETNFSWHF